ncbi:MAG: nucleotidyltransferase domain-containing protein [Candidatus Nanoarchaeia archaeon]|nr:nucleotidyltransferase domain-containing protein [Candidatus Nanoarchaeia archaeon]
MSYDVNVLVFKKFKWFSKSSSGFQKVYKLNEFILNMVEKLKNIALINLNESYQKVLCWFFSFPDKEIGLNKLCKEVQISKTTAKKIVEDLIKEDFLVKKTFGKTWILSCNKNHSYNFTKKVSFNLAMISEAYERYLREKILKLVGNANSVILFGSYRKGDDTETSDIDVAVEVSDNKNLRIVELGVLSGLGFRKNVPVNLHIFCRNKIDVNLFSNIANGILLEGFLEVKP